MRKASGRACGQLPEKAIVRAVDLSTAHLARRDAELLEQGACNEVRHARHDYGWVFFLVALPPASRRGLRARGFSRTFVETLVRSYESGAVLLNYDRDAMIHDGLRRFHW